MANQLRTSEFSLRGFRAALAVIVVLGTCACAIKLAPSYDDALVKGLTSSSEKTLTLFAAVSDGAPASVFAEHEKTYAELIGQLEALKLSTEARRVPPPRPFGFLQPHDVDAAQDASNTFVSPSTASIQEAIDTIKTMRDRHRSDELTKARVDLFRNEFVISMDQALTYEQALKR